MPDRRLVVCLLACVATVSIATGCGDDQDKQPSETPKKTTTTEAGTSPETGAPASGDDQVVMKTYRCTNDRNFDF